MHDTQPTPEQIAALDYVSQIQRECRAILEAVGLEYAASRVAQFDDPLTYQDDQAA
jgi:hypothetical protein